MKMICLFGILMAGLCFGGDVEYGDGDVVLEGFVAKPEKRDGKVPLVLVVHQWKGLGDYEKRRCRELAQLGYVAFAVDVYGKGVRPESQEAAGQQAGKYKKDRALFRQRLKAGLDAALEVEGVDTERVAAIGYCFGGTGVLELARSGADVGGVVSFHGGLDSPTPADGAAIKGRVLALHGAADPFVSEKDLEAFEAEMKKHEVDWELVKYGGAVHGFTQPMAGDDPSKGAAYDAEGDERSWARMKDFLASVFSE